jgi:hypothetical protein
MFAHSRLESGNVGHVSKLRTESTDLARHTASAISTMFSVEADAACVCLQDPRIPYVTAQTDNSPDVEYFEAG